MTASLVKEVPFYGVVLRTVRSQGSGHREDEDSFFLITHTHTSKTLFKKNKKIKNDNSLGEVKVVCDDVGRK